MSIAIKYLEERKELLRQHISAAEFSVGELESDLASKKQKLASLQADYADIKAFLTPAPKAAPAPAEEAADTGSAE